MKKISKNSFSKFKKHMKAHKTTEFLQTTLKNYVKKQFSIHFPRKNSLFFKISIFSPSNSTHYVLNKSHRTTLYSNPYGLSRAIFVYSLA